MGGMKDIDYDGIAESPTNVVVSLTPDYTLSLPRQFEIGDCFALQKKVKYVYETRCPSCYYRDSQGNCYSKTYTSTTCRSVVDYEWVRLPRGEAKLTVSVPEDAAVFINDRPTTSTGTTRVYLSQGLAENVDYWYWVRVRVMRNGKVLEKVREVILRAGESKAVSIRFSNQPSIEQSGRVRAGAGGWH